MTGCFCADENGPVRRAKDKVAGGGEHCWCEALREGRDWDPVRRGGHRFSWWWGQPREGRAGGWGSE